MCRYIWKAPRRMQYNARPRLRGVRDVFSFTFLASLASLIFPILQSRHKAHGIVTSHTSILRAPGLRIFRPLDPRQRSSFYFQTIQSDLNVRTMVSLRFDATVAISVGLFSRQLPSLARRFLYALASSPIIWSGSFVIGWISTLSSIAASYRTWPS